MIRIRRMPTMEVTPPTTTTNNNKHNKSIKKELGKILKSLEDAGEDEDADQKTEEGTHGATEEASAGWNTSSITRSEKRTLTTSLTSPSSSSSPSPPSSSSGFVPRTVRMDELQVGNLLGTGGYSNVLQVRLASSSSSSPELGASTRSTTSTMSSTSTTARSSSSTTTTTTTMTRRLRRVVSAVTSNNTNNDSSSSSSSSSTETIFAMKRLHLKRLENKPDRLARQVADLKHEGQILASLNERHDIVSIFAWSFFSSSSSSKNDTDGSSDDDQQHQEHQEQQQHFFLILERLDYTLEDKLEGWRMKRRSKCNRYHPPSSSSSSSVPYLMDTKSLQIRSQIIFDLASVLQFLHSKRILHRDLKPANVGFQKLKEQNNKKKIKIKKNDGEEDQLKLFDMGLARVLPNDDKGKNDNDQYHLTGMVGTLRYMSPECGRRETYGLKSDVYSFGLMCYEILSLQEPFGDTFLQDKSLVRRVWYRGERPNNLNVTMTSVTSSSSTTTRQAVVTCITKCWNQDATARPSMEQAQQMLNMTLPMLWEKKTKKTTKTTSKKSSFFWKKVT